jgi:hypothetical protein
MSDRNWYIGIAIGVVVLISAVLIVVLPKKSGDGSEGGSGNMPSRGGGGGGNMPDGCGNCFMADADCAPVPDPNQQGAYVNSPNALGIQCAKYFVENGQYVLYDPRNPPNPALQSTFINSNLAGACDNLMVAKDGNCGSCYQQVYNAHLDKCTRAGDIRRDKPDMTCATLMANMDCGAIDTYVKETPIPTDPDYVIHKQVQDCYFQGVNTYKNSFRNPPENIIQSCTQDCQQEDSHYFPFKPCGTACSDACNRR